MLYFSTFFEVLLFRFKLFRKQLNDNKFNYVCERYYYKIISFYKMNTFYFVSIHREQYHIV